MTGELLKCTTVTEPVYDFIFPYIQKLYNYQDFFSKRFGRLLIHLEVSILFFWVFFLSNMDEDSF